MEEFAPFGPDHVAVLSLTAAAAGVLLATGRRLRARADHAVRWGLGLVLIGNETLSWLAAAAHGQVIIPLQLCDLALVATVWALFRVGSRAGELAYFWVLAGSTQAVLTPDLLDPFPSAGWASFFISHCGMVLGVVYLTATGRIYPTPGSIWRVWLWVNGYAAVAGLVNGIAGTNFGYLARKPSQPSLLDYFGPWPFYILAMEAMAAASFALCYVPFALTRRSRGRPR